MNLFDKKSLLKSGKNSSIKSQSPDTLFKNSKNKLAKSTSNIKHEIQNYMIKND